MSDWQTPSQTWGTDPQHDTNTFPLAVPQEIHRTTRVPSEPIGPVLLAESRRAIPDDTPASDYPLGPLVDQAAQQAAPHPYFAQAQWNHSHPTGPPFNPQQTFMNTAQVQSAPVSMPAQHPTPAPPAPQQANNNVNVAQFLQTIWRSYWDQVVGLFAQDVPASLRTQVVNELSAKRYEWSGNQLYRAALGIDKLKEADLQKLKQWMYDGRATTDATWRDTLRSKPASDRTVPWVTRERLIALSVFFKAMRADQNGRMGRVQTKFAIIHECKLDFLLSSQDQVNEDPYWAGFPEAYANDPEQKHIYDNVMGIKKSPSLEKVKMEPGLPEPILAISGQQAQAKTGKNHAYNLRSSRQRTRSHQAGLAEPQKGSGQEESLEDKVRRLEEENNALRRHIDSMKQQPPRA